MTISISNNVLYVELQAGETIHVTHKEQAASVMPNASTSDPDNDGDTDFTGDRPNDR